MPIDPTTITAPGRGTAGLVPVENATRIARAGEQVANTAEAFFTDLEEKQASFRRQQQLNDATAGFSKDLIDFEVALNNDPAALASPETWTRRYEEFAGQAAQKWTGSLTDQAVREQFDFNATKTRQEGRLSVFHAARKIEIANSDEKLKTQYADALRALDVAEASGNDIAIEGARRRMDEIISNAPYKTEGEKDALRRDFQTDADVQSINRLIAANPGAALSILEDEQRFYELYPGLSPGQRIEGEEAARSRVEALRRKAEAEIAARRNAEGEVFDSNLRIRIANADSLEELAALDSETEQGYESGLLDPGKRATRRIDIAEKARKIAGRIDAGTEYDAAVASGAAVSQDVSDDWYEQHQKPLLAKMDPRERMMTQAGIVIESQQMPKDMQEEVQTALGSPDPVRAGLAAELIARIHNDAPTVAVRFSKQQIALATIAEPHVASGLPAEKAVELARERMKIPENALKMRMRDLEKQRRNYPSASFLGKEFNVEGFGPDAVAGALHDRNILADFESRVSDYYALGMDLDQSRGAAVRDMRASIAVTNVDGIPRLMRDAPELRYPEFKGDTEALREHLLNDLKPILSQMDESKRTFFGIPIKSIGDIEGRIRISTDFNSARELGADGNPEPSYLVWLDNGPDDAWEPLVDPNAPAGSQIQVRWTPRFSESPAAVRLEQETVERKREDIRDAPMVEREKRRLSRQLERAKRDQAALTAGVEGPERDAIIARQLGNPIVAVTAAMTNEERKREAQRRIALASDRLMPDDIRRVMPEETLATYEPISRAGDLQ